MKTLLLLGGSGFFGKSFLDYYQRGGLAPWDIKKIIIVARNPIKLKHECPQLLDQTIQLIHGDLANMDSLPSADYVIHMATLTDSQVYQNHAIQEKILVQNAIKHYCNIAIRMHQFSKILYISSGAVYGQQPDALEKLSEGYASNKIFGFDHAKSVYAEIKQFSEKTFQCLKSEQLNIAIARCFAFVGPWLPRDQHFAIGNFLEDGLRGRPIEVKAKQTVYRSYMYADDLVEWLMTICANASDECPIFNVGSDEAISLDELAHKIAMRCNVPIDQQAQKIEAIHRYVPSIDKARRNLNLKLKHNLDQAIDLTLHQLFQSKNAF